MAKNRAVMIKKYLLFRDPGGLGENGGGTILVETTLVGQATDAEIQAWKVKYKQGIYQIEDEGHVAYFQNPTRQIMNASMSKASTEASLDMYELCAKLCFIGGSDQVMKDEQGFFGLTTEIKKKMDGRKVLLKNL